MKKICALILTVATVYLSGNLLLWVNPDPAYAKHRLIFRDASDLTTGTVSNFLLDPTSVTLQGNNFNGAGQLIKLDANGILPNLSLDPSSVTLRGTPWANGVDAATTTQNSNFAAYTASNTTALQSTATTLTNYINSNNSILAYVLSNASSSISGGGGGVRTLYLSTAVYNSFPATSSYLTALTTPSRGIEATISASVTSANGLVLVGSFTDIIAGLGVGVTKLPAGVWEASIFATIDSVVGQTDLVVDIATMNKNGSNPYRIVSTTDSNITALGSAELFQSQAVQQADITISSSDLVLFKIYAKTTSALARTVTITLEGTSRASRIETPVGINSTIIGAQDLSPNSYAGQAGKILAVNATETGFSFATDQTGGGGSAQTASTSSVIYNLVITTNGTNTNTFVMTADAVDVMGDYYTSVATAVQFNLNGIGGIDTGSEVASTWYKFFFCSNGTTLTVVASSYSNTTPTFPSGFTKWREVGSGYNDSSSNVLPTYRRGVKVQFWKPQTLANDAAPAGNIDTSIFLPPKVSNATLNVYAKHTAANQSSVMLRFIGHTNSALSGNGNQIGFIQSGTTAVYLQCFATLPVFQSRTLYFNNGDIGSGITNLIMSLNNYEEDY